MSDDKNREVKPWDLLNPKQPRSGEELSAERLTICRSCEWFRKSNQTCKKCGCFMKLKTTLERAACPIGKW
jgi:ribosomal protein L32